MTALTPIRHASAAFQAQAYDYAERIRARLPRRLQELREAVGLSKYALAEKAGVSREMVSRVEGQRSIPAFDLGIGVKRSAPVRIHQARHSSRRSPHPFCS